MSTAQKKAVAHHRERLKRRGLVRLEVLAPQADVALIRDVVEALRDDPARAAKVRARLRNAIAPEPRPSLLELLADTSDIDLDQYLRRSRELGRDVEL